MYGFCQHQHNYFDNQFTDGTPNFPASSISVNGGVAEEFISDRFNATKWLTIIAGLRQTEFRSSIAENATDPRVGDRSEDSAPELGLARLLWSLLSTPATRRQPPARSLVWPTARILLSLLSKVSGINNGRLVVIIPYRGWNLEVDNYQTNASNWLDHNNIGESNLFWPITWYGALIQGWDLSLRSPLALASRPVSPRLCESNRAGNLTHHRRLNLPPRDANMPAISAAGIWTGRP